MTQEQLDILLQQQSSMYNMLLSVTGFVFLTMFAIVAFFVRGLVTQQKTHGEHIGKLTGRMNTMERLSDTQLQNLTDNVNKLTTSLDNHTKSIDERMHQKDKTNELLMDLLSKVVTDGKAKS